MCPIIELAGGGCLSVYRWNGGGTWNGMAWNQDLPSDPQVYNNNYCLYMIVGICCNRF